MKNSASFAEKVVLERKTGRSNIQINKDALYEKPGNNFTFFLEWPGINKWTQVYHSQTIKWLSGDRDKLIASTLKDANMQNGFLFADIINEKFQSTGVYYPGCKHRPYMTCDDLGYSPVNYAEVWDSVNIKLGEMDIWSYVLISTTRI